MEPGYLQLGRAQVFRVSGSYSLEDGLKEGDR